MGDLISKRLTQFENHRSNKLPVSQLLSVITKNNTIETGWSCGRSLEEINKDFGQQDKDWFYFQHQARAYLIKNGLKEKTIED